MDDDEEAALASARAKLLQRRADRIRPGWDDKILSDWNGLMIAALANTAAVFQNQTWLEMAIRAYDAVKTHMSGDHHLMHSLRLGKVQHFATADGYANMIRAATVLYEVTAHTRYLDQAVVWAHELDKWYWDGSDGGYFFTSSRTETLIARTINASDDAVPNANAVMAGQPRPPPRHDRRRGLQNACRCASCSNAGACTRKHLQPRDVFQQLRDLGRDRTVHPLR